MTILKIGDKGDAVLIWENFLVGRGFYDVEVDGVFDVNTQNATKKFQEDVGLIADGMVGPRTLSIAKGFGCPDIQSITPQKEIKPFRQDERENLFGKFAFEPAGTEKNPEAIRITDNWAKSNIEKVVIPQLESIMGENHKSIAVHKKITNQFINMFIEFERLNLMKRILTFDGTWVPRFIRGSRSVLSNHAWGTAFDINVPFNPLGAVPAARGSRGSVHELVEIADKHGFLWGGHFKKRPDGMHFEAYKIIL
jgi:hypothetical protein